MRLRGNQPQKRLISVRFVLFRDRLTALYAGLVNVHDHHGPVKGKFAKASTGGKVGERFGIH